MHRSIGGLMIESGELWANGSAFLISPNLALTAAHNVFNHRTGQTYQNWKLYLPTSGGVRENFIEIESVRYPTEY
jgi:V8-like Glu-specific endopeptidase